MISNRKMKSRIKILMDILIKIDSLWINTCANDNVLNDDLNEFVQVYVLNELKSIILNFKISNDTILIDNLIMVPKILMVCNNSDNNCDYFIYTLYKMYFKNNRMHCSVIRMVIIKRKRKTKMLKTTTTIPGKVMNIVYIFLVIDKTDRYEFILIIYSMILILYIIWDDIYQLNGQIVIETKVKHENKLQDNLTYNKKIFEKIIIVCCVFILIFVIVYVLNHEYIFMHEYII